MRQPICDSRLQMGVTGRRHRKPPPWSITLVVVAACLTDANAAEPCGDEPEKTALGSDRFDLRERYPAATWVAVDGPALSLQYRITVSVGQTSALAIVDTGAARTVMSEPLARSLGVTISDDARTVRIVDAHGDIATGQVGRLSGLRLGDRLLDDIEVWVIGEHPSLFLIGVDLLRQFDLYFAAEAGLIGFFDAGKGPRNGRVLDLIVERGNTFLLPASARSMAGEEVRFSLIVDSGSSITSVPAHIGVLEGLPADTRFESSTRAVAGETVSRGRFSLDELALGDGGWKVHRVLATASQFAAGKGPGLLGNDVLSRQETVISFTDHKLVVLPVAAPSSCRCFGPDGRKCRRQDGKRRRCIQVGMRVNDEGKACVNVNIDRQHAGTSVELAMRAFGKDGIDQLAGGALRVYATVFTDGFQRCLPLPTALTERGISVDTHVHLARVRAENFRWGCDPLATSCLVTQGPLDAAEK